MKYNAWSGSIRAKNRPADVTMRIGSRTIPRRTREEEPEMSASARRLRLRLAVGLGVLALLGVPGCRQMHQRQVLYPNGDGRGLVNVRTEGGGRAGGPVADRPARDEDGSRDVPPMLIGR